MGLFIVTVMSAMICGQSADLPHGDCEVRDSWIAEANNVVDAERDWQVCLGRRAILQAKRSYDQVECDQFDPNDSRTVIVDE